MAASVLGAASASISNSSENITPDPHATTAKFPSKRYCLAHSNWMIANKSKSVCAFCGVKKKKHTAPLLMPDATILDFVEISAVENPMFAQYQQKAAKLLSDIMVELQVLRDAWKLTLQERNVEMRKQRVEKLQTALCMNTEEAHQHQLDGCMRRVYDLLATGMGTITGWKTDTALKAEHRFYRLMETEGTDEFKTQQRLLRQWEQVEKEVLQYDKMLNLLAGTNSHYQGPLVVGERPPSLKMASSRKLKTKSKCVIV